MNTYGDSGNVLCLQKRCAWKGIDVTVHQVDIDQPLPEKVDLYFFGGGQDAAQAGLSQDLVEKKGHQIIRDVEAGAPLLAICGGYQLLGTQYLPFDQAPLKGVGLFPAETRASHDRMIGNLIIEVTQELANNNPTTVVGFENHSGKTTLLEGGKPLGIVRHGSGNNGTDHTEGCRIHNAIGCYLHGSLLPKNPHLADWLIQQACRQHDPEWNLPSSDDALEWQAHTALVARYT